MGPVEINASRNKSTMTLDNIQRSKMLKSVKTSRTVLKNK